MSGAGEGFTSISPLINQGFFVGDGLTGTGTGDRQTFIVPAGATTIWLGLVDGQSYTSGPGYYDDNGGSFTVRLNPYRPTPDGYSFDNLGVPSFDGIFHSGRYRALTCCFVFSRVR